MLKVITHKQKQKPIAKADPGLTSKNLQTPPLDTKVSIESAKPVFKQTSPEKTNNPSFQWSGQVQNVANMGANTLSNISKVTTSMNETGSQTALALRDSISDAAINSGNPYAMAIGAAAKVVDAIGDATGLHTDALDKKAAERAGVGGEAFINNAMQALPAVGTLMGFFSGDATDNATDLSTDTTDIQNDFSGSMKDIDAAHELANKKTLFGIGRDRINAYIENANKATIKINEIGRVNTLAKLSTYDRDVAQQNLNRYAGTQYQMHAVGKNGMKILSRKELQTILATRKLQKGGVIGIDTNIIPDGSLHARLNHLQDTNPDLEDTTKKGIPVLDSNGEQVAEIEREELVLSKALTEKIELLANDGSDEAMIEAGKLLVSEILENTQDNTGTLLNNTEDGK